jgi:hypothetical protein
MSENADSWEHSSKGQCCAGQQTSLSSPETHIPCSCTITGKLFQILKKVACCSWQPAVRAMLSSRRPVSAFTSPKQWERNYQGNLEVSRQKKHTSQEVASECRELAAIHEQVKHRSSRRVDQTLGKSCYSVLSQQSSVWTYFGQRQIYEH